MNIAQDLTLARQLAYVSDRLSIGCRPAGVRCWTKQDGSEITELDLAIEAAMLEILARERPNDAILAEESGASGPAHPANGRRWVIDPLDGTRSFLNGGESWGTHIALETHGRVVVAIITRPTQGLYYWGALGQGAWLSRNGESAAQRLRLSTQRNLATAKVVGLIDEHTPLLNALRTATQWIEDEPMVIDAFLEGRVDALIDQGGNAWDQAPLTLLVPEAGGSFSDPQGGCRIDRRFGLYSGNPDLHAQLWEIVAPSLGKER